MIFSKEMFLVVVVVPFVIPLLSPFFLSSTPFKHKLRRAHAIHSTGSVSSPYGPSQDVKLTAPPPCGIPSQAPQLLTPLRIFLLAPEFACALHDVNVIQTMMAISFLYP